MPDLFPDPTAQRRTPFVPELPVEPGPQWLIDGDELEEAMRETLRDRAIPEPALQGMSAYRRKTATAQWPLQNLIPDKVDKAIWSSMIQAQLLGMVQDISQSQPNGQWEVCGFDTKRGEAHRKQMIGMKITWIDLQNNADLLYEKGEIVSATTPLTQLKTALGSQATSDTGLAAALEKLAQALSKLNLQGGGPGPKSSSSAATRSGAWSDERRKEWGAKMKAKRDEKAGPPPAVTTKTDA